jgi:hypothetical protein
MNLNKTISANSKGITISFGDVNKHQFVYYNNTNDAVRRIQINGTAKYQAIEHVQFNKVQQCLYNQAVYGLKSFSNEAIMEMEKDQIRNIKEMHNRAMYIINDYKQEVSNAKVDAFLSRIFPNSPIVKQMLSIKGTDPSIKVPISLKDLKITSTMLSKKLVECNVLPKNFFNLV